MKGAGYRYYVLTLLLLNYAFNFLDRNIVTIVAPYLKADLGISDAQIGLLFGTAFALFFAVFGLPLAKLADGWSRVKTISLGLSFWSLMTAVSGMASSYAQLGLARMGVGVGEASASPAAYSLLQDYFPKSMRATALAIYSSGIYVGAGAALWFGASIAQYWEAQYTPETAPFGLAGWQATYFAFGIPGIILAILMITTVREPVRGAIDGLETPGDPAPVRAVFREFAAMLPPWNWRAYDRRAFMWNAVLIAALTALTTLAIHLTDGFLKPEKRAVIATISDFAITTNMVQWAAIAIGVYCSVSWFQTIRMRDPATHKLVANPAFVALALAGGLMSFVSFGMSPFVVLYGKQAFAAGPEFAKTLGLVAAFGGGLGATLGGMLGDMWRKRHPAGRVGMMAIAAIGSFVSIQLSFRVTTPGTFLALSFVQISIHIMWLGPCAASIQDLVLPRMRGTASAVFFLSTSIIGLGCGPYIVGLISDISSNLRFALMCTGFVFPLIASTLFVAWRNLPRLEATVLDRARAAGEAV